MPAGFAGRCGCGPAPAGPPLALSPPGAAARPGGAAGRAVPGERARPACPAETPAAPLESSGRPPPRQSRLEALRGSTAAPPGTTRRSSRGGRPPQTPACSWRPNPDKCFFARKPRPPPPNAGSSPSWAWGAFRRFPHIKYGRDTGCGLSGRCAFPPSSLLLVDALIIEHMF